MKRVLTLLGCTLLLVFAATAAADSPETGVVLGRAVDANGDPMPGVTVTISGDRGDKVAITSAEGGYRFALLTPGQYVVRGSLDSYRTAEAAVNVTPGARSEINLVMGLEAAGEITVTAEAPVINRFESTSAGTVTSDVATNVMSVNTNYYSSLALLPGVTSDGDLADEYPGSNGSRWMEGAVFVDGVDTTYTRRGGSRMYLPHIAVSSTTLQSTTGGAEYGRAVGGVTNVVTKSGTNRLHGEYFVHRQQGDWVSEYKSHPELAERWNCRRRAVVQPQNDFLRPSCQPDFFHRNEREKDYSDLTLQGSLGGPIVRNKAWFFAAAADTNTFSSQETFSGDIVDNSAYVGSRIAKLNFQPSPSHSLAAYYTTSPLDVIFVLGDVPSDRYTATPHEFGGELLTGSWNWSATSDLFLEFKLAFHDSSEHKALNAGDGYDLESALAEKQQDPRYPPNNLGPHSPGNNFHGYVGYRGGENHWWNGWILDNGFGRNDYPRDQANARVTWFASEAHEALFGFDWQDVAWEQNLQRNNLYVGNVFDTSSPSGFDSCSIIRIGYRLCYLQDYSPADLEGEPILHGTKSSNTAFFAQDRFSAGDHWTFNLGLRYEDQVHLNDVRRTVIDSQDVSPRIFGAYDFRGDGRTLLSLSLGRAYQHLPQDLSNNHLLEGWNGTNAFDRFIYCDDLAAFFLRHVCRGVGYTGLIGKLRPGTMWRQIDAGVIPQVDIDPYFKDEIDLSLRWALNPRWYFQASAIYWTFQNSIGTTEQRLPDGNYFRFTENYKDYEKVLGPLGVVDPEVLANFDEGKRTYRSLQLQLNRNFRNNWALFNNLTYADARGHFWGGLFNNTNSDYGRNLDVVLTQGHIDGCAADQLVLEGGQPVIDANGNQIVKPYPLDCQAILEPFLGQPVSTIYRYGTAHENNEYVWNSFGWKTWNLGNTGHSLTLGGSFSWRSGKPWQRQSGAFLGGCNSTFEGCDPEQAVVGRGTALYLEPRGARDPFNPIWNLNLTGIWSFRIRGDFVGNLRMDATNVTNNQDGQRVNAQGEFGSSRYIDWQRPRRFSLSATFNF